VTGSAIFGVLILALQAIRSNREQCALITARLFEIITVIVTELKGKAKSDYPPDLTANLEKLARYIESYIRNRL
jgi:hypothetical protein